MGTAYQRALFGALGGTSSRTACGSLVSLLLWLTVRAITSVSRITDTSCARKAASMLMAFTAFIFDTFVSISNVSSATATFSFDADCMHVTFSANILLAMASFVSNWTNTFITCSTIRRLTSPTILTRVRVTDFLW